MAFRMLINLTISLIAIVIFLFIAEYFTRAFWNQGYRHNYDWRNRTEGYSIEKNNGVFRILILGDSNAFGQGVKREETFAKIIENKLNETAALGKLRYEVINLSKPGLNTAQEYVRFKSDGLKYRPDLVMVAYCLNDVGKVTDLAFGDPRNPNYIRRPLNRSNWKWALPIPSSIDDYLTLHSDLYLFVLTKYDLLLKQIGIRERGIDYDALTLKDYSEDNLDWKFTQHSLKMIYSLGQENGIKAALVILPYFHELQDYKLEEIHNKVANTARGIGFYVMDLLPSFNGLKNRDFIVSTIDTHPNYRAHQRIAKDIYQFLIENNLTKGK